MISAIFVLNSRGDVLISRLFRDDVSRNIADIFRLQAIAGGDARSPISILNNTSLLHVRQGDIFLLAATKQNVDCTLVFSLLRQLLFIFRSYFGGKLDEDHIRKNFVLIYELLDEVVDYGYPQNSDIEALKLYITQAKNKNKLGAVAAANDEKIRKITVQVTGAGPCPWRQPGIKYRKNELFIDVVESVNLLISAKGNILNANVSGQVIIKSLLSGMPECKFGLNDKLVMAKKAQHGNQGKKSNGVELDDCTFHQCVKLNKFESDRTISFIPPDGVFELMKYRTTENPQLPFRVLSAINEVGSTRIEIKVTVKANFSPKLFGQNVVVRIPTPKNTATCRMRATAGKAYYSPEHEAVFWKIKRFIGGAEFGLSGEMKLAHTVSLEKKGWTNRPPIAMQFQVPMFTSSGFDVRFLKVYEKSSYHTVKWVRYVTRAGSYEFRI